MSFGVKSWCAVITAGLFSIGMRAFLKNLSSVASVLLLGVATAGPAGAEMLSGARLVDAIRQGGYVLLMRHASSPRQPPDATSADPDNKELERQLDEAGRAGARTMGKAIAALRIPIGEVLCSPTFRARETAKYAGFEAATVVGELGDGGHSMQPDAAGTRTAWLRNKAAETPRDRANTLLITHQPNIVGALGEQWSDVADGETLVVRPGPTGPEVIARVKIDAWSGLAAH